MLPSQFLQFATSYHLLPSLTISYHLVPASHDFLTPTWSKAQAWRKRCRAFVDEHIIPYVSQWEVRFAAVCQFLWTVGSTISITTSRRKVNKAVPKEAYIQCAEASLLLISVFHLDFPSQICTKICKKQKQKQISLSKFKTGWSVADRRRPTFRSFWPRALRCPRGAGTWKTSIFGVKKSKIFKTLRDIVLHCLQLTTIELNEWYEEFKTFSSDVFYGSFPLRWRSFEFRAQSWMSCVAGFGLLPWADFCGWAC